MALPPEKGIKANYHAWLLSFLKHKSLHLNSVCMSTWHIMIMLLVSSVLSGLMKRPSPEFPTRNLLSKDTLINKQTNKPGIPLFFNQSLNAAFFAPPAQGCLQAWPSWHPESTQAPFLPSTSESLSLREGTLMRVCLLSLSTTSCSFPLDFSISFRASVKDMFSVTVPLICVYGERPCYSGQLFTATWKTKQKIPILLYRTGKNLLRYSDKDFRMTEWKRIIL